jgi:hypothetical protein
MSNAVRVVSPGPTGWSGWSNVKSGGFPGLVRVDWVVGAVKNFRAVIAQLFPAAMVRSCRPRAEFLPNFLPTQTTRTTQTSLAFLRLFSDTLPGPLNHFTQTARTISGRYGGRR